MKSFLLVTSFLLSHIIILSQALTGTGTVNHISKFNTISSLVPSQIYDNGTNVGLGTTTPGYKLDVNGTGRYVNTLTALSFIKQGGTAAQFLKADGTVDGNVYLTNANAMVYRGGVVEANINSAVLNGYYFVDRPGIDQSCLLTINAAGSTGPVQMNFAHWGDFKYRNQTDSDPTKWTSWKYVCTGTGIANQLTRFTGSSTLAASSIFDNGTNVGIGITTPLAKLDVSGNVYFRNTLYVGLPDANTTTRLAGYALAVNGNAIFNKAKVMLYNTPWADFVFDEKYGLMSLIALEKFISIHKHLPDVPSAEEVEKEGIDLGSTQSMLLQKIEELTLYTIGQNKQSLQLQAQIVNQQSQINKLILAVEKLKANQKQ